MTGRGHWIVAWTLAGLFALFFGLLQPPVAAGGPVTPLSPTLTPTFTPSAPALTATPGGTPQPTPTATLVPLTYALVNVPDRGTLHLRSRPDIESRIVGALAAQQRNIPLTGRTFGTIPRIWYEVRRSGGGTGWISSYYVVEYVPSEAFCRDERVKTLLAELTTSVKNLDGALLARLVSPMHGVTVRLSAKGTPYNFLELYARYLYWSTYPIPWGKVGPGGKALTGSFKSLVTPRLQEVFGAQVELYCNDASRLSGYAQPWPPEYQNVNFYTVFRAESKPGAGDWRAWLVGVDYVNRQPYLYALIHYQP